MIEEGPTVKGGQNIPNGPIESRPPAPGGSWMLSSISTMRFLELRDGRDRPKTEEELIELGRFIFRSESASIEQALEQHKKPSPAELRERERQAVRKLYSLFRQFVSGLET